MGAERIHVENHFPEHTDEAEWQALAENLTRICLDGGQPVQKGKERVEQLRGNVV